MPEYYCRQCGTTMKPGLVMSEAQTCPYCGEGVMGIFARPLYDSFAFDEAAKLVQKSSYLIDPTPPSRQIDPFEIIPMEDFLDAQD